MKLSRDEIIAWRCYVQGLCAEPDDLAPVEVVGRMAAMQAQKLPDSMWGIGVRSRATRDDLERRISEGRELARGWPMRGTLHLMVPGDVRWLHAATARGQFGADHFKGSGIADVAEEACAEIVGFIRERGSASLPQLKEHLKERGIDFAIGHLRSLVYYLTRTDQLILGPINDRGNSQDLVLADEWFPDSTSQHQPDEWGIVVDAASGEEKDAEAARVRLVLRYLRGHGPATDKDMAWWSGLPVTVIRAALQRAQALLDERSGVCGAGTMNVADAGNAVAPDNVENGNANVGSISDEGTEQAGLSPERLVQAEGPNGEAFWMLLGASPSSPPTPPAPPKLMLLPSFDEYLLGYADRSHVLPDEHARAIDPLRNGSFKPVVVADGHCVGTWTFPTRARLSGKAPLAIDVTPFDAKSSRRIGKRALHKAALRVAAHVGRTEVISQIVR
ncbi:MAG: winged helix DNA-binding domain-containing protein [Propionibacteriaceae bacterium]|jgi:hypothetical protein|nr:winged helix DNA-binding domain-containing protein [Propionibacteriaceae bacterium]